ncbi:TPA: hypothetical protein ACTXCD_004964, partial [Klebsiella quasipneumoniae subsp. similipneumoniae]
MVDEYNTGNPVPSSAMPDAWDNNATIDKFVNSTEMTVVTRTGVERDTMAGMQKKADDQRDQMAADGAAVVEETRQNLIPLSRQYMTLDAAQADIANIPEGSTTYVRSADGSSLADEYINNGGTLEATGREMPSKEYIDSTMEPVMPLVEAVEYLTPAEFERSGVDSATLDKNRRILMCWAGNKAFYISISAKNAEFEAISVGGTHLDSAALSDIVAIAEQIEFTEQEEYSRSGVDFAVLDKNNRIITVSRKQESSVSDVWFSKLSGSLYQLYKLNSLNGAVTQLEVTTANETNIQDRGDIVIWNSDRVASISNQWFNGSVPGNLWFSPKSKYSPHPVSPRPNVAFWGHSFTADPRMAARLYEKTNLQCFIFGRSNGISNGIAARQGGRQQEYMPVGGVIPATATAVNLVPNKPGPLALGGNGNAGDALRHCWLAGVYGKLAWDGSQVTFTRDVAGDAVQVPYAVPLRWEAVCTTHCINTITNQNTWAGTAYPQNAEAINVLWIGRNNYADLNQVVHDLVGMVELIEKNTLHPRIVIMPEFPAQAEVAGSAAHTAIMALNAKYKSLYPEYYCEVDGIDALENFRRHYNPA